MTVAQKIRMVLAARGMAEAELARRLGTSPSAFNQRMKTDRFSADDLVRIAEAMNCTYSFGFTFNDTGETV